MNKRPVDHIRYGNLEASIWENQGENGPFYSATFSRSFQVDGEWKQTQSFNQRDMELLGKLTTDTGQRMSELTQSQSQEAAVQTQALEPEMS